MMPIYQFKAPTVLTSVRVSVDQLRRTRLSRTFVAMNPHLFVFSDPIVQVVIGQFYYEMRLLPQGVLPVALAFEYCQVG